MSVCFLCLLLIETSKSCFYDSILTVARRQVRVLQKMPFITSRPGGTVLRRVFRYAAYTDYGHETLLLGTENSRVAELLSRLYILNDMRV